jgi:metallo-beta-lactamase family protein
MARQDILVGTMVLEFFAGRLISFPVLPFCMKLEFHGAAGGVTGSHTVLEANDSRIGIDAGLYQGSEGVKNRSGFGYMPGSLKALLLTHAHVDHCGRIPLLVKEGFPGSVYSTSATKDLCEIMLKDSAHLMAESNDRENRHPDPKQDPPRPPLYTESDVLSAMKRFQPVDYEKKFDWAGISINFRDAGHILGSAMIELTVEGKKIVFSGDLGRPGVPILRDPEKIDEADYLVLESTYGNREHEKMESRGKKLLEIVQGTLERGGNDVIPAFAVGRTQEILYELNPYAETGALKGVKCYVDSPMAISAGEIYSRHPECFDSETLSLLKRGDSPFEFPGLSYTRSTTDSKAINDQKEPHIIISASGMCTGGRILHHLIQNLGRKDSTILFVGYQAEGTLGQKLVSGSKSVQVMDRQMDVQAKIESLESFSAHAGRSEILQWLHAFKRFPETVFLNHGEPDAVEALSQMIRQEFGAEVVAAQAGKSYMLD